jgi:TonB family protein
MREAGGAVLGVSVALVLLGGCAPHKTGEAKLFPERAAAPTARYVPDPVEPIPEEAVGLPLTSPRVIDLHTPTYPDAAKQTGMEGEVLVEFLIGTTGEVEDARVVATTSEVFNRAALEAARNSHFEPGLLGSKPIAFHWIIPFEFSLGRPPETARGGEGGTQSWRKEPPPDMHTTQPKERP